MTVVVGPGRIVAVSREQGTEVIFNLAHTHLGATAATIGHALFGTSLIAVILSAVFGGVVGPASGQQAGRQYWFAPRNLDDLAELRRMFANDTSAGVGYAPLGPAEQLALTVETELSSAGFRQEHP